MSIVFKTTKRLIQSIFNITGAVVLQFRTENSGLFRLGMMRWWENKVEFTARPWGGRCPQFADGCAAISGTLKAMYDVKDTQLRGAFDSYEGMSGCCDFSIVVPKADRFSKNVVMATVHMSCNNKLNEGAEGDALHLAMLCEHAIQLTGDDKEINIELIRVTSVDKMRGEANNLIEYESGIKLDIT